MMFRRLSYEPLLLIDLGLFGVDVRTSSVYSQGAGGRVTFTLLRGAHRSFIREFKALTMSSGHSKL